MAHMEQELEILREELRQVRDLAKLSATTFLTFKTPIYFPKVDLSSADLPNHPELTQHTPTHGRVPLASPTAVRTVPDFSNREPTIPTMQRILGAHVTAPYEPHVPPVYAAGAPTFTTPAVVNVPYEGASDTIFMPEQTLIPDQVGNDDIVEGIGNLFVAMAGEEEEINLSKLTIRDAEPAEILQNWNISPSLFQPESW
uniref:Uncharacterized protein n=1 Tax=Solanum tuberosum TaxID=4113 RepID=M1DDM7_SOLTU